MRGLTSLTEPGPDDPVGAVVDVAVIGARGDGKTQLIVHAIRTLRAYAPLLEGAEHQYNRDVLQVVMNAREPRPEATAPGVVPHYVFRIRPDSLLSQVGLMGRLGLYARVARLWSYVLLAVLNAAALGALLGWLRGGLDSTVPAIAGGVLVAGGLLGTAFSRRRFIRRGDIEIVFWDVAGEHVYSASAADYYSFLGALVRMRRQHASPARSYAFAPVLICNPVALGTRVEGSSYARLRQLMPLFASLNEPLPRAMVAINRWAVVQEVGAPDSDRDEVVAIVSAARAASPYGQQDDGADPADSAPGVARPLPLVKRDVLRKHCLDAEDGVDGDERDVDFAYLRYDAGIQCEFRERSFDEWHGTRSAASWRAPTSANPDKVLEYTYEDGPGSFKGEVRRAFLNWVAQLAFHEASYGDKRRTQATALEPLYRPQNDDDVEPAPSAPAREASAESWSGGRYSEGPAFRGHAEHPAAREPGLPAPPGPHDSWRPRPHSAKGLDEFARGTIAAAASEPHPPARRPATVVPDIDDDDAGADDGGHDGAGDHEQPVLALPAGFSGGGEEIVRDAPPDSPTSSDISPGSSIDTIHAIDASLDEAERHEQENHGGHEGEQQAADARGEGGELRRRESTQPGVGPARAGTASARMSTEAPAADDDHHDEAALPERQSSTLRMPGGFGNSGT